MKSNGTDTLHLVEMDTVPDFESFYEQNWTAVCFYLMRKIGNREIAEDLAQTSFLYCYEHFHSYDPSKSSINTWLYLVVNSRLKNYYRDKKSETDISELENLLFDEETGDFMGKTVWLEQLRSAVAEAIAGLPERQQQVVIRRYFMEESIEMIAEALATTPGNTRVILSRTLNALKPICENLK